MKLHALSMSVAFGLFWGLSVLLLTLLSVQTGYAKEMLGLVATVYPGYTVTTTGAFAGLVVGFLDGFIGAYILVWLYNSMLNWLGASKKK